MTATRSLRARLAWTATAVVGLWIAAATVGATCCWVSVLARQADALLQARAEAVAATVQIGARWSR